ncbi:zinc knuckle-domain-containing protein [Chaetomium sp. MPI-CAGE-AT-0009]|nr:zinc knuckle-domain-containing protein [Chaetomium sp. MPI-CAGE-AT-0009]
MHSFRGRSGPSKATPSNVQCQKCLKRGHYSYECKSVPQERPYIARPSRTQQLFNPKLLPKLASETPNPLQEKKGVADEELAKREAERARERERELDEDAALRDSPPPKRHRSPSYDSVSSISTRSPSPAPRRSRSPERRERRRDSRSPSPRVPQGRKASYDSADRYSRGPSESPARDYQARGSRPPLSPSPRRSPPPRHERVGRDARRYGSPGPEVRGRDSYARRTYSSSRSRSPVRREDRGGGHGAGRYRDREDRGHRRRSPSVPPPPPPRQPSPPRERSLSPFSKRLALTQAMGRGR